MRGSGRRGLGSPQAATLKVGACVGILAGDNFNKSSASRGGGSVGRGALNLPLRGFTYRRPQN